NMAQIVLKESSQPPSRIRHDIIKARLQSLPAAFPANDFSPALPQRESEAAARSDASARGNANTMQSRLFFRCAQRSGERSDSTAEKHDDGARYLGSRKRNVPRCCRPTQPIASQSVCKTSPMKHPNKQPPSPDAIAELEAERRGLIPYLKHFY